MNRALSGYSMLKRALDCVLAAIGLVVTWPLFALLAVWIRLDSGRPIFYKGRRVGRWGIPFTIYKFRTMVRDAETLGPISTSASDPRVTRPGRLLRRTKLDELPQLINVLRGDMSLVGPRPEVPEFVSKYGIRERPILLLRPGITDWASIWNSNEGAILEVAKDPDQAYERVIRPIKLELQLRYVSECSVLVDFKILIYTIIKLVWPHFTPKELAGYPNARELKDKIYAHMHR